MGQKMEQKKAENMWISSYLREYEETIRTEADKLRDQKMPDITEALYDTYEKTGDRTAFENVYFTRRRFLAVYGMAAVLFHREEDISKLSQVIAEICQEQCWALPAHVNKSLQDWKHTVELYASETAHALTEICYVLGNELSKDIKELIEQNVDRRVLHPFFQSKPPYAWWEETEMNWSAVCAGCIGTIVFYRYGNQSDILEGCIERIRRALEHYREGFAADGACMEGLDYWTYGMTYYAMFAHALAEYTNGREDLLRDPSLRSVLEFQQKCYLSEQQTLSFSDGSNHSRFRPGLTLYLRTLDQRVVIPDPSRVMHLDDDAWYHWAAIFRDYIWTKRYGTNIETHTDIETQTDMNTYDMELEEDLYHQKEEDLKQLKYDYYFPDAQWVISRNDRLSIAVKGGHNDEPHNHNDVGSFLYGCDEIQFLTDLGAGEYTRDYFNQNRYRTFCNNAESHNIPIINEILQKEGKTNACNEFTYLKGDSVAYIRMDLSRAYDNTVISKINREIKYNNDITEVVVTDTFLLTDKTESITENLVTGLEAEIMSGGFIISDGQGRTCTIEFLTEADRIQVIKKEHKDHEGNLKYISVLRWQIPFAKEKSSVNHDIVTVKFRIKGQPGKRFR